MSATRATGTPVVLLTVLFLSACAGPHNGERAHDCVASGGKWVAASGECELDNKG